MPSPADNSHLIVRNTTDGILARLVGFDMLDEATTPEARALLIELAEEVGSAELLLDLADVRFLTSTGMGMLVALHNRLQTLKGKLALCGINDEIFEVLEITQLTRVLDIRR